MGQRLLLLLLLLLFRDCGDGNLIWCYLLPLLLLLLLLQGSLLPCFYLFA